MAPLRPPDGVAREPRRLASRRRLRRLHRRRRGGAGRRRELRGEPRPDARPRGEGAPGRGPRAGGGGALVREPLLGRLGLRVGDPIEIGTGRFTITGVLKKEPDRAAGFSLGPRVLIGAGALERTALVQFCSRVRYRPPVRLPEVLPARAVRAALVRELPDPPIRGPSLDEAQPG